MDTIKLLENTEVGMYMVVVYDNNLRCPALYMGEVSPGVHQFIDNDNIFKCTNGYIRDHVTIDQELDESELFEIAKILEKIKA